MRHRLPCLGAKLHIPRRWLR